MATATTPSLNLSLKSGVREANAAFIEERPWERFPDESVQAYARFMTYRNSPSTTRSLKSVAKLCGISDTLVSRWSKKYKWVARALAYDSWMVTLSDELDKSAVLCHRRQLVRFGSVSLDKAHQALDKVQLDKLSVSEINELAKVGSQLARTGLGLSDKPQADQPIVQVNTGVVWAGEERPAWLAPKQNTTQTTSLPSDAKQNEVLVNGPEKVLGETSHGMPRTRLLEKVVDCPVVKHTKGRPMGKFD